MDVQALDQRLTMKYHLSKVRLREFVWVGGHVTVAVGWASGPNVLVSRGQGPSMSWDLWPRPVVRAVARGRRSVHRSAKTASRSCFGALVYTVAPLWTGVGTQECTQIDENGPSGPFWDIRIIPTNEPMLSTFRKTPLDVG